jgi:hypothetical protein
MSATSIESSKRHQPAHTGELFLLLLLVGGFSLAADLSQWFQSWPGNRTASANLIAIALGDAGHLFANHFFVKADAYFHSGFYPTIYDNRQSFQTPHIAEDSGAMKGQNTGDETSFLGPPRNWVEAFGREFYPSVHTHLSDGGANGEEGVGTVREILPWLKLSTELDPKRVQTYIVTAYWLRRMDKIDESEQVLREGLKENPGNPQLLFDLGRLFFEAQHNPAGARNVWEAGLRNLDSLPLPDNTNVQNRFSEEEILAALANLETQVGNTNRVLSLLQQLKEVSTTPVAVEKWINEYKSGKRQ